MDQAVALAYAQIRSAGRLTRTWVFGSVAIGATLCVFSFYAYTHGVGGMGVVGGFAPRLLIGELGVHLVWVLLVGVTFIAFDFRDADVRAHIAGALDAKPATNLALIIGRLAGTIAVVAIPVVVTIGILQLAGWSARRADYWMGDMIEPFSLVGFVLVDVLPALVFWCAFVMLLSAVLRNRIVVLIAAVTTLAVQVWLVHKTPAYAVPALSLVFYVGRLASDLVPSMADLETLVHRGWLLLMAAGFCVIAAAIYPRLESGSFVTWLIVGLSLTTLAVAGIATTATWTDRNVRQRDAWLAVHHTAGKDLIVRPDIQELSGHVRIDPGRTLEIDIELYFAAPGDLHALVFSLNPGMRIESLRLNGHQAVFTHEAGLLTVHPTETLTGTRGRLALEATGVPDPDFGYLGSVVDWRRRTTTNLIRYLGTEASLFHSKYVALTPAVHWLPTAGVNVGSQREPDLFRLDIVVEAPTGWLIAGPGRQPQPGTNPARFAPMHEVRDVGLYAARFDRHAVTLHGVELELLVSPVHMPNLSYFAPARDAIVEHLSDLLADLQRRGLQYEDRVLSLVEVPSVLRTYGGGWRLSPFRSPGVVLLREERLPLARFGLMLPSGANPELDRVLRLQNLFIYLSGGFGAENIFRSFAGTLVAGMAMEGDGADAFDHILGELATRSLFAWASNPYGFSAHAFDTEAHWGSSFQDLVAAISTGHFGHMVQQAHRDSVSPQLWPDVAGYSLAELASLEPRRGTSALFLKGASLAQSIVDTLGVEGTQEFLGRLRDLEYPIGADTFIALADQTSAVVGTAVEQAWRQPGLPGFIASPVDVVRLGNVGSGQPEAYQITVHVRNEEAVSGAVRLDYNEYDAAMDPVWVSGGSAVEIGIVVSQRPNQLWLIPYLSLNRQALRLTLPREAELRAALNNPRFVGARPSSWRVPVSDDIVVDDLSAGFSTRNDGRHGSVWGISAVWKSPPADSQERLPDVEREKGEWVRRSVPGSWGRYRHTVAQARSGNGEHRAVFEANLAAGRWRLDYHLPPRRIPPSSDGRVGRSTFPILGSTDVDIVPVLPITGASDHPQSPVPKRHVKFDGASAHAGWNTLGEFDLRSGGVRVEISNLTDGQAVIADAIRWRRLD